MVVSVFSDKHEAAVGVSTDDVSGLTLVGSRWSHLKTENDKFLLFLYW